MLATIEIAFINIPVKIRSAIYETQSPRQSAPTTGAKSCLFPTVLHICHGQKQLWGQELRGQVLPFAFSIGGPPKAKGKT